MKYFIAFWMVLASLSSFAQPNKEYSIKDKKAIKMYEAALLSYDQRDMPGAQKGLEELLLKHPEFIEAQYMLAQVYDEQRQTAKAIVPLKAALETNPNYFPAGWLMLAEAYFSLGNYEDAEKAASKYMAYPKNDAQMEKRTQIIISSCVFAKKALQYPVPFEPINMGPEVNTDRDEYYPCITADEQTLLFTRLIKDDRAFRGMQEDFYITKRQDKKWILAQPVLGINTPQNEGAPTLSADGQTLIFTACESADGSWGGQRQGIGSCDLFYTVQNSMGWSPAKNMGQGINTGAWESQPSYSADGRTLYFVRGKRSAGGIKEQDIYYCYINDQGKWSTPQKVPGKVNTSFEEESVMIHPDGRTMYFSSNGHSGMGGLDIYMSRLLPSGDWDTPQNLGFPINTFADENSLQVTASGKVALFASSRQGGFGGLDLYQFNLYDAAQPTPVTYVTGVVSDKLSFKKLEAHLELIDLESGKTIVESYSNQGSGEFLLCIPSGRDYALNVSKEGYLFHSENFSLKSYKSLEPYRLDIKLQKLKAGANIVLNNVFFDPNSFELKPASKVELNKLASLLQANPERNVEIGGHTDNVGNDPANQLLSENRAKAVVEYLTKQGVNSARLSAKGYGETVPIETNDTEAGRAKNRRTEFKILN